ADLLVSQVNLGPEALSAQGFLHFLGKRRLLVGDIHDHRLGGSQPGRERPFVMLDQDTDEALERPQDSPVQHDRVPAIVVFADVLGAQTYRQVEVQLQGTALPDATQTILQREFRSEEHTSELQSREKLVCRLLLEKKN